jgi:uncharacterized protein (DUF2147 family)
MKNTTLCIVLLLVSLISNAQHHNVLGQWKSIDDVTGKALAIIELYEKSGKIFGRVHDILDPINKKRLCINCTGDDKNKPILGMTVIKGLIKDQEEYNSGKILDPKSGKLYKCYITLEEKDKLKVRGFIGVSIFGRTQYWHRVKH